MAPIKLTFCCTLLTSFYFHSALASPDLAIMARLAHPIFTPSAGTAGFGSTNSTAMFPTGTGTGFGSPTGYGLSATSTSTTIPSPVPEGQNIQRRKAPSKASAGFGCHNGTHHHATGHQHGTGVVSCSGSVGTTSFTLPSASTLATPIITSAVQRRLVHVPSGGFGTSISLNDTLAGLTGTGTGTGVVHATGTGAIGSVSATETTSQPRYTPAVVGRSKKAAWSWWG